MTLYNEIDPFAAAWLRSLIEHGHVAAGVVDERSIEDLTPADVAGPGQRHFFAGIGGWSYALRLAGIPDDADIWTGSCPCQPFSQAGARQGFDDARHLWPAWFALVRECRPATVFGEQVAGPDGLAWLDGVCADLEGCGYAVGAAVLSAGGVSAPHGRHRIYFVAHADTAGLGEFGIDRLRQDRNAQPRTDDDGCGEDVRLANAEGKRRTPRRASSQSGRLAIEPRGLGDAGRMGNADRLPGRRQRRAVPRAQAQDAIVRSGADRSRAASALMDPWRDAIWIDCADGKRRPIPAEPSLFPLAHGVPNRVGLLRGSGNAIVPQVAAAFVMAAMEASR